jgi:tetratricopeptide (TPR) repeat protein
MPKSPSKLRAAWLTAVLAVASTAPAAADLWYEHYARAEKALQDQEWSKAIEELNQALERKGDSGARVRTYGMKVIAYFPYLKLGVAYYHLGQLEAALNAFETEERLGAVAGSEEDLQELETTRTLVLEVRGREREAERLRIRQVVEESLEDAHRLEATGQLREAAAALGRALAVDPDNAEANADLKRLRTEIARRDEELDRQTRQAGLIERGKRLLDSGAYGEAASALRQALDLAPDPVARDLLTRAQEGLRREMEPIRSAERDKVIETALEEARSLEEAGSYDRALEHIESALALRPGNAEALALQTRLLRARQAAERDAERKKSIDALLKVARDRLSSGRLEDALSAANEILALDPANGLALEALATAYRQLNRSLLGTTPRQNLPPAISFADLRSDLDDGLQAERVNRPTFRLNGVVIDQSPVHIAFHDLQGRELQAAVRERPVGDVVITEFSLHARLRPGLSGFRLTATDSGRLSTSSEYAVLYARPFYRAPWFYALATAAVLLAAGVVFGRRVERRHRLRTRRFNPYVAGAPVLDDKLFFGRRDLLDRILQTVHNNSLLLFGERRIGKTSIQHRLRRRLQELDDPEYRFFPVYIDLQGVPEEAFFRSLADDIFEELAPHLDGLKRSRPDDGHYGYRLFVRDLHAVIRVLKRRNPKRVKLVLLIDEIDELNDYDPRINQRLRSLFMKSLAEHLVAVVSGVEIRKRWEREASPWYNFFEELEVKAFGKKDARALVERPIHGLFKIDDEGVERILSLTACRPYRIQKLCMAIVNRMHEQHRRRITVEDIEAVGCSSAESS